MGVDSKENAGASIQHSEKETIAFNNKGLKEDLKKKEKEVAVFIKSEIDNGIEDAHDRVWERNRKAKRETEIP